TDAVALEDGKAQRSQRRAQFARERPLVGFVSMQEAAQVTGLDARLVVECFLVLPLGQVVLLLLVDLVVADEGLVGGLDPLVLPIGHRAAPPAAMIVFVRMAVDLEGGCRVSLLREGSPREHGTVRVFQQIGRANGAVAISLRVLEVAPGRSPTLGGAASDEVLYVFEGKGMLRFDGGAQPIEA